MCSFASLPPFPFRPWTAPIRRHNESLPSVSCRSPPLALVLAGYTGFQGFLTRILSKRRLLFSPPPVASLAPHICTVYIEEPSAQFPLSSFLLSRPLSCSHEWPLRASQEHLALELCMPHLLVSSSHRQHPSNSQSFASPAPNASITLPARPISFQFPLFPVWPITPTVLFIARNSSAITIYTRWSASCMYFPQQGKYQSEFAASCKLLSTSQSDSWHFLSPTST